ncbi:MAG TPA: hypothetical protein VKT27_06485 [Candidatus Binataceae bacterium]|nr:hypothetical protein [Candidatus Binataceae bacterium]
MKKLAIAALIALQLATTGCAAFIAGSALGSLGYAGYEYASSQPSHAASPEPSAQPTLSLNDIE